MDIESERQCQVDMSIKMISNHVSVKKIFYLELEKALKLILL